MNPSIEIQINARLDKLDAALTVAEAKITQSAVTMGKAGHKGGTDFANKFTMNLPMIASQMGGVVVNGLLQAVKDSNAGKSGQEIGISMASGIVEGAKSLPVLGIVFSLLDEMVNGAEKAAELMAKKFSDSIEKRILSTKAMMDSLKSFTKGTDELAAKNEAGKDPMKLSNLQADKTGQEEQEKYLATRELEQQRHVDRMKEIKDKFDAIEKSDDISVSITYSDKKRNAAQELARTQHRQNLTKIDNEAARRDAERSKQERATDKDINDKAAADAATKAKVLNDRTLNIAMNAGDYQGAQKAIDAKAAAEKKVLDEKLKNAKTGPGSDPKKDAEEYQIGIQDINLKAAAEKKTLDNQSMLTAKNMGNDMVADWKTDQKEKYDVAMKVQKDIIDVENAKQDKISKMGSFDKMAGDAGKGMINSGKTALGQFNFAQQGASNTAVELAKKQVDSLKNIENATAEQVRLTKDSKVFQ